MKRSPMPQRKAPMRRARADTEFAALRERPRLELVLPDHPPPRRVISMRLTFNPQPKENPLRSEAYRRLVASMRCRHCGRAGPSQCAHADMGKGMGIKADDRLCWPACADAPGRVGCHTLLGASGMFTREQRRTLEARHAADTRAEILASGKWPENLPPWEERNE